MKGQLTAKVKANRDDGSWMMNGCFRSYLMLICVPQGQGAKDAFQKGFRDKLKKKNRYARSIPELSCKSEMFAYSG